MCLYNISTPIIATEDKECFKVVKKNSEDNLFSYKENHPLTLGNKETSVITFRTRGEAPEDYPDTIKSKKTIERALHSYSTLIGAEQDPLYIRDKEEAGLVIAKCIIPKGSTYYEGITCWFNWDELESSIPSYASDVIILNEIIEEGKQ
jgi:hypothetical protein